MFSSTGTASVTCIVPARNEAGYLVELVDLILGLDLLDEVIICEGGSQDNTWEVAQQIEKKNPKHVKALKQSGKGLCNAVVEASRVATSDLILIWNADGTVPVEDTRKIIELAQQSRTGVTGNRLLGKMEKGAMRFANKIGNWAFAIAWVPLLRRKPIDLLCGTKIFPREVFDTLPQSLINLDPYGDFALIAHANTLGIPLQSITVNYRNRVYGESNIKRWSGGVQLLKTTIQIYALRIKS